MAEPDVISLRPLPLTQERFAPYGDVIEASHDGMTTMNDARFERFDSLCNVDVDGDIAINVTRCRTPTALPLRSHNARQLALPIARRPHRTR